MMISAVLALLLLPYAVNSLEYPIEQGIPGLNMSEIQSQQFNESVKPKNSKENDKQRIQKIVDELQNTDTAVGAIQKCMIAVGSINAKLKDNTYKAGDDQNIMTNLFALGSMFSSLAYPAAALGFGLISAMFGWGANDNEFYKQIMADVKYYVDASILKSEWDSSVKIMEGLARKIAEKSFDKTWPGDVHLHLPDAFQACYLDPENDFQKSEAGIPCDQWGKAGGASVMIAWTIMELTYSLQMEIYCHSQTRHWTTKQWRKFKAHELGCPKTKVDPKNQWLKTAKKFLGGNLPPIKQAIHDFKVERLNAIKEPNIRQLGSRGIWYFVKGSEPIDRFWLDEDTDEPTDWRTGRGECEKTWGLCKYNTADCSGVSQCSPRSTMECSQWKQIIKNCYNGYKQKILTAIENAEALYEQLELVHEEL